MQQIAWLARIDRWKMERTRIPFDRSPHFSRHLAVYSFIVFDFLKIQGHLSCRCLIPEFTGVNSIQQKKKQEWTSNWDVGNQSGRNWSMAFALGSAAEAHFNNGDVDAEEYNDIVDGCCCLISFFGNIFRWWPSEGCVTSSATCQSTAAARNPSFSFSLAAMCFPPVFLFCFHWVPSQFPSPLNPATAQKKKPFFTTSQRNVYPLVPLDSQLPFFCLRRIADSCLYRACRVTFQFQWPVFQPAKMNV